MEKKMRICISSPPDRENLVAEIFFDDEQWAELNQESGKLNLEIYPKRSREPWRLEFDETMIVLAEAKRRLTGE